MSENFDVVIGLEIHAQMNSLSKCFSSASTNFGLGHNENVTAVCAGMPGTLPVLNEKAVELSLKTSLALNCEVQSKSVFSRKQYFYPDMPKGYQITQFHLPIAQSGYVEFYLDGEKQKVNLERAHMEEDAGKSTHFGEYTLINLNRAGIPLLEIVSKPEISSSKMAAAYAKAVRQILRYSEVCDGNLEEGSMRCDCNVSIKPKGQTELGTKVELKNINSFRFIEKALDYEISRQIQCKEIGEEIIQETRLYDSVKNKTFSMRKKEEANDYRYFPEPDLLPLTLSDEMINQFRKELPEQPIQKFERYTNEFQLTLDEAELLTSEKELGDYFEKLNQQVNDPKLSCNWVSGEFLRLFNESDGDWKDIKVTADNFGALLKNIQSKKISGKIAKEVFEEMWNSGEAPDTIIESKGLSQISDEGALLQIVTDILNSNTDKVTEYKSGKEKLYGFFVGQIMKATKGQANPEVVNKLLKEGLK